MTRILLLGIVAIAVFVIAPKVGASRSVTIAPNQAASDPDQAAPRIARTVFDAELDSVEAEDVADRQHAYAHRAFAQEFEVGAGAGLLLLEKYGEFECFHEQKVLSR